MPQSFIIGRGGNQPFGITAEGVSAEHVCITITDQNLWFIEDLAGDNGNGTYLRDEKGDFYQIFKKQISEDSVIRLGRGGHHSYTFMACRLLSKPKDFGCEFTHLRRALNAHKEKESKQEEKNGRNAWIAKCAGIVTAIICIFMRTRRASFDPTIHYLLISATPVLVGVLFRNDAKKLRNIRQLRGKIIVCPNCRRPLSDFDVDNMQCSMCKAR